ncbi:uncharacterized protein LOC125241779 isoform X1 [Leguminivora glycinivorella]|uniref:uncharacterized protein LOC125241779 isoform X1 n=1 Tax=Leguminivora glycinivorella TaxID=1035111 RepID=UPI0020100C2F|nr:uncharacterized protein LOC125241779 isoform X1 [Leguminivora glycinivorella]
MPLVKDLSYREMPSSETANADYHEFLSLGKLIAKITNHQQTVFRCRSVGVLSNQGLVYTLADIDDRATAIRVSLRYMKASAPYSGKPYIAQIFGFAHWFCDTPILYAINIKEVQPPLAKKLCYTMEWIVNTHKLISQERRERRKDE